MGEMILAFLNSTTTVYVLWGLCLLSFLFFVGYAVSREGRDLSLIHISEPTRH